MSIDMGAFVAPKSNQLNADDLIAGPRTIRIARVSGTGNAEQPVAVHFDGDDGKPYLPCKSMRRVMIGAWGSDAAQYAGRSMTIYRDPKVLFGGMAVGGIRISHMSHIEGDMKMALTVTQKKRELYVVKPMPTTAPAERPRWQVRMDEMLAALDAVQDGPALMALIDKAKATRDWLRENQPAASAIVEKRFADAFQQHVTPGEEG